MTALSARKSALLCAAALLVAATAIVQAQVEVWRSGYNGPVNDWDSYLAVALAPDSALVATGYITGSSYVRDIVTAKISRATGDTLWVRTWDGGTGIRDEGVAVAADEDGNVFVAGRTRSTTTDTDYVTLKYLPDGTLAWARRYHFAGVDVPTALAPDGRGGVFVTGRSNATAGNANQDYLTLHYASDSTLLWGARFNGPGNAGDYATALALDGSGNLYVTGYSWTGTTPRYDYCTVRYDTTDGDTVWARRYDGTAPATKDDYAYAMTCDDSGYVYVTGKANEVGTTYDATTVKYDATGAQVWVNRFDTGSLGTEGGSRVGVDAAYNVYVGGHTESWETSYDVLVFRINQSDNSVPWFHTYNYVNDDDTLMSMAVDPAGNCYLLAEIYTYEGDVDWATVKYTADGTRAWVAYVATYDEDDEPAAVVVDELGDVYCAGWNFPVTSENCLVVKYTEDDAGVVAVVFPADTFRTQAVVTPKAWVRNFSAVPQSFPVRMEITGGIYYDAQVVNDLPAYDSVLVEFLPWPVRDVGTFPVLCYSMLAGDKEPANDSARGEVTGIDVWEFLEPMPVGPKNRGVKDGGALALARDSFVFALKGNNTTEYYRYNTRSMTWSVVESIPPIGASGSKKRVKAGGNLESDGGNFIYAFKGNNTNDFFRYSVSGDSWRSLADYPLGAGRRVKGGSGLAYVAGQRRVYAVKGNNSFDFAYYDVTAGTWTMLPNVPAGDRNKKVKDGTGFAYDGENTIYLLKGNTYEFYAYDIPTNAWRTLKPIPNSYVFPKRRKVKKGGGGVYDTEFDRFYAMKGGKTCEFWYFDPAQDSWVSINDSFPKQVGGKPPYYGADLYYGGGKIYALRGNKTLDFLRYNANFPLEPQGGGAQAGPVTAARFDFRVWPNPVFSRAAISYSLPSAGRVRLVLYDITGRQARVLLDEWQSAGERQLSVDARGLAAGVYLARLSAENEAFKEEAGKKILIAR